MIDIDTAWAEGVVSEFITLLQDSKQQFQIDLESRAGHRAAWEALEESLNLRLMTVMDIADKVNPNLSDGLNVLDGGLAWRRRTQLTTAQLLLGAIQSAEEVERHLTPQGPKLAAANLHPWIWEPASDLWANGHPRAAVQAAATSLFDIHLPQKLGRARDVKGGADLMGQALTTKDPIPGSPRLRFTNQNRARDEKSWTSAHEGAMHLGQGCAQAIRNLTTHDLSEPEEQKALEMLAALSLVARLVDEAIVVVATDGSTAR